MTAHRGDRYDIAAVRDSTLTGLDPQPAAMSIDQMSLRKMIWNH